MRYCVFILAIIVLPAAKPIEAAMIRDLEKNLIFASFLVLFENYKFHAETALVYSMLRLHMLARTRNAILTKLKYHASSCSL